MQIDNIQLQKRFIYFCSKDKSISHHLFYTKLLPIIHNTCFSVIKNDLREYIGNIYTDEQIGLKLRPIINNLNINNTSNINKLQLLEDNIDIKDNIMRGVYLYLQDEYHKASYYFRKISNKRLGYIISLICNLKDNMKDIDNVIINNLIPLSHLFNEYEFVYDYPIDELPLFKYIIYAVIIQNIDDLHELHPIISKINNNGYIIGHVLDYNKMIDKDIHTYYQITSKYYNVLNEKHKIKLREVISQYAIYEPSMYNKTLNKENCNICYTDAIPIKMECGHTICGFCLNNLKYHICPFCRKSFNKKLHKSIANYSRYEQLVSKEQLIKNDCTLCDNRTIHVELSCSHNICGPCMKNLQIDSCPYCNTEIQSKIYDSNNLSLMDNVQFDISTLSYNEIIHRAPVFH